MKIVSKGFTEGFYYKPRVDHEVLEKYHEGLICLSACLAGEVPRLIEKKMIDEAEKTVLWFKETFGADNAETAGIMYIISHQRPILQQLFVKIKC